MELDTLQTLAITIAQERSVEPVLQQVVQGLAAQPGIALARLWLNGPGDQCATCPMRSECPQQTECLHLLASAGNPTQAALEDWSGVNGDFRRFPLRVRKIGHIGATGEPILIDDVESSQHWIARPNWARKEGIRSFAGQPLVFRGEVLGVLAIFSRLPLTGREFAWLRMFADHAAVAIANSRAFAEIERLRERIALENAYLRSEVKQELAFGDIIGQSPALWKVLQQIELVARSEASVLVLGESGTGKELLARAIHERSPRAEGPMVKVNCASIPRELFESEFFGHVKGSFTGAVRDRAGRFQLADGGTLFLDEVGEIPLDLQSKLLRVLQEGQFERVGDERTRTTNLRIVAATNRNLLKEVEAGRFRQDLYYRLSVFPIEMPPLRDRREDIPLLVSHFIALASRQNKGGQLRLLPEELERLTAYDWPGNVRELQNVIERAMILSNSGAERFPISLVLPSVKREKTAAAPVVQTESSQTRPFVSQAEMDRMERENLLAALEAANWKVYGKGGAAELLGVNATTLASRMKIMGIVRGMKPLSN
ncbi:MAG: sigma 54-interacting transcriptional regulator [Blastocatellia bacterium]|nr:sigma 54-interacting transcriptional regulator [Blastocatellia bacterium]